MACHRNAGFTLIECVFAIFIFSVGALGLAATTGFLLRSLAGASARERSAWIAAARIETIRASSCAGESGSERSNGIQSTWTVVPASSGLSVIERVTYFAAGSVRTDTYTAVVPCGR